MPPAFFYTATFYTSLFNLPGSMLFDAASIEQSLSSYDGLIDRTRAHGVSLLIVDDPMASWFPFFDEYRMFQKQLSEHLEQREVEVVKLFDFFLQNGNDQYFWDTCHLIEQGYVIAAQKIWEHLKKYEPN